MGQLVSVNNNLAVPNASDSLVISSPPSGDGIIFSDDFESGDQSHVDPVSGANWGPDVKASVTSSQAKSGTYAMEIQYEGKNSNGYEDGQFDLALGPGSIFTTTQRKDLHVKFDMYIPSHYNHQNNPVNTDNNKSFVWFESGTYGGNEDPRGATSNGDLYANGSGGSNFIYEFSRNYQGTRTQHRFNHSTHDDSNGVWNNAIVDSDKGKWMELIIHVKLATWTDFDDPRYKNNAGENIGIGDGVYEMWVTKSGGSRQKVMDIHDLPTLSTQSKTTTQLSDGYNWLRFSGWRNSGFSQPTSQHYDNIIVSTESLL